MSAESSGVPTTKSEGKVDIELSASASTSSMEEAASTTTRPTMANLPLPVALRPFAHRLQELPCTTDEQVVSILFIVCLVNAMQRANYATFLTLDVFEELCKKLNIKEFELDIAVFSTRFMYKQGLLIAQYHIAFDTDGLAIYELSRIALEVRNNGTTPEEGLKRLNKVGEQSSLSKFEKFYRAYPGRLLVPPCLACSASFCFFGGTAVDLGVAFCTGAVVAGIQYFGVHQSHIWSVQDLIVSIVTGLLAVLAVSLFPDYTCVKAVVLATLMWFYYGLAFFLSLYEATSGLLLVTGLSRFGMAFLNTYVLAFGTALAFWMTGYATNPDRFDQYIAVECDTKQALLSDYWLLLFYPMLSVSSMAQLRISPRNWPLCILVQYVAQGLQYLLTDVWKQPIFVSSFVPAFCCTLAAHFFIMVAQYWSLTEFSVKPADYLHKKYDDIVPQVESMIGNACQQNQSHFHFVDSGWEDSPKNGRTGGYIRRKHHPYRQTGLWFCLLPALYVLVPGSSVYRNAFWSIADSVQGLESLASTYFAGGILSLSVGLVLGVRMGIETLWFLTNKKFEFVTKNLCVQRKQRDGKQQKDLSSLHPVGTEDSTFTPASTPNNRDSSNIDGAGVGV